ncbi:MAG: hypothetical protein C4549_04205 [Deltaproteobacteria bacterium]|jgi:hypothetical protein|nr:MAG: hypothetical protein C4549_04205 [Deltaproteobacteria bacterium]
MKKSVRKRLTEGKMEFGQGRHRVYTSLPEVSLIHLVNDGNLKAREELLRRMLMRIQRKGGGISMGS